MRLIWQWSAPSSATLGWRSLPVSEHIRLREQKTAFCAWEGQTLDLFPVLARAHKSLRWAPKPPVKIQILQGNLKQGRASLVPQQQFEVDIHRWVSMCWAWLTANFCSDSNTSAFMFPPYSNGKTYEALMDSFFILLRLALVLSCFCTALINKFCHWLTSERRKRFYLEHI